ncbi:MAG: type II toxin-antitoxin system VapC family toxin [Polyangiaceae bacterium]|nr:type II toxin-antitoxin system VapC family toxin [Polyangiaceae bacterium]
MNLVADTHAILWFLGAPKKLSAKAKSAFEKAETGRWTLFVPVLCLYEAVLLGERGRIRFEFRELVEQLELRVGFRLVELSIPDVDEARNLASLADPFDRVIVGTALRLGLPLITADERIRQSGVVEVYW